MGVTPLARGGAKRAPYRLLKDTKNLVQNLRFVLGFSPSLSQVYILKNNAQVFSFPGKEPVGNDLGVRLIVGYGRAGT